MLLCVAGRPLWVLCATARWSSLYLRCRSALRRCHRDSHVPTHCTSTLFEPQGGIPSVCVQNSREFIISLWSHAEGHRVKLVKMLGSVQEVAAQAQV